MKSLINFQKQNAINIYDETKSQVKIIAKRQYILGNDIVITADNIKKIGELIALLTIRTVMCRSGKDLYRLYDGLIKDCNKSNDSLDEYSDGYDIPLVKICGFVRCFKQKYSAAFVYYNLRSVLFSDLFFFSALGYFNFDNAFFGF